MAKKLTRLLVIVALLAMVAFGLTAALGGLNNVASTSDGLVTALQVDPNKQEQDDHETELGDPTQTWWNKNKDDPGWEDIQTPDVDQTVQSHVQGDPIDQEQTGHDEGACNNILNSIGQAGDPQSAGYNADNAQVDIADLLATCG